MSLDTEREKERSIKKADQSSIVIQYSLCHKDRKRQRYRYIIRGNVGKQAER